MPTIPIPLDAGIVSSDALSGGSTCHNLRWDAGGGAAKRPGKGQLLANAPDGVLVSINASPVIGTTIHKDRLIFVTADRKVWMVASPDEYQATALSTSDVTTQVDGGARPTFAEDNDRLFIAGGGQIQKWAVGDASTSRISTPTPNNDPPFATHVIALGGYIFANDTRDPDGIHFSDPLVGGHLVWPPLSFQVADARTDDIVGIGENTREAFVWGAQTLQVYGLIADPFAPLSVSNTINSGLGAPNGFIRVNENMAWLDHRLRVVLSNGHSDPQQLDAGGIDKIVAGLSTVSDCWMAHYKESDQEWLLVFFPGADRSYGLDLLAPKRRWVDWAEWNDGWSGVGIGAHVHWPSKRKHVVGSKAISTCYTLDRESQVDFNDRAIVGELETAYMDGGGDSAGRKKRLIQTFWSARRGQGLFGALSAAVPPIMEFRVSDDGGPWKPWTKVTLGTPPDYATPVRSFEGGVFRKRRIAVRHAELGNFLLANAEMDVEVLP